MTLILALECADGLLLASDSQSTFGTTGQPVKAAAQKVHCQWSNVVWGAAGSVAIMQWVQEQFRLKMPQPTHFVNKSPHTMRLSSLTKVMDQGRGAASQGGCCHVDGPGCAAGDAASVDPDGSRSSG